MRLWADMYNAAGARQGGGPVALRSASVTRVLDGVGSITITVPGTDGRAVSRLQNESSCRIWMQPTDSAAVRELGRGTIRRVTASGTPSDWSLVGDGPDDLDGLTRVSTKLRRTYSGQTVSAITTALVALVSGWSVSASGGNATDARFDGVNVFKALLAVCEQQGLHLRAGTSAKTIEVGAFGTASGLRLINPAQMHPTMDAADELAVIETISVEKNSEAVCNRLYPIGAGIGEAWQTIFEATRNTPYIRNVVLVNGIDQHFLEDSASIALYGIIEKMGRFQVSPLSNSVADVVNAANALYDWSAAWLTRYSVRQDVYRVTAKKVRTTVRPGDKVRVIYNGVVTRDGEVVNYLDIDDDFWVMEVTERMGVEGAALDLVLSTVDRHAANGAQVVIGALEELQVDGVSVKPFFNMRSYVYDRLIDIFTPGVIPVRFTNATRKLNRCLLKIKTGPFISTVAPDVTNTLHRHTTMQTNNAYSGPYTYRNVWLYDEVRDGLVNALLPISEPTAGMLIQSGQETSEDYITVDYGLHTDTATPSGMRVYINDVDYTTALGGSWFPSGGSNTVELDITSAILDFTLQQEHLIEIRCTGGQGTVEAQIEVYETIQAIDVG